MEYVITRFDSDQPLPRNFVPIALGYLREEDKSKRNLFVGLVDPTGDMPRVFDPNDFKGFLVNKRFDGLLEDPSTISNFGPPIKSNIGNTKAFAPDIKIASTAPTVVLIDVALAFWHGRFRTETGSNFSEIYFFDEAGIARTVSPDDIIEKFQSGGNAAAIKALSEIFKQSVYGTSKPNAPAIRADDFAHGTAMADFILRDLEDETLPRVIALELPKSALTDQSGASLSGLILQYLLPFALNLGNGSDLHIIMPYAFTGGPHDTGGNASLLADLEKALENYGNTRLYLPTGNHLQDRLHVQLPDVAKGSASQPITWRLKLFDDTRNIFEIWWKGTENVSLTLTDRNGDTVSTDGTRYPCAFFGETEKVFQGGFQPIKEGEWNGLLICLAATAPAPNTTQPLALAGDWRIQITPNDGDMTEIQGWVLRDDAIPLSGLRPNAVQSELFDPAYRETDYLGLPLLGDPGPDAIVRRCGSASFLTSGTLGKRCAIGASEGPPRELTSYSGRLLGCQTTTLEQVGTALHPGVLALCNGAGKYAQVQGTSTAVALALNRVLKLGGQCTAKIKPPKGVKRV